MGATTNTTYVCDECREPGRPNDVIIELGEYGVALHPDCFAGMSAARLLRILGEDETLLRQLDDRGARRLDRKALRYRDATKIIDDDGLVALSAGERVDW